MKGHESRRYSDEELALLWRLIRSKASLAPVRDLLKANEIPSSGSADQLFSDRIQPALSAESPSLSQEQLIQLLRDHEEIGNQNTFLYWCPPATARKLSDEVRIRRELERRDLQDAMIVPRMLDTPERPGIVDVRLEGNGAQGSLILKVIETRLHRRQVETRSQADGYFVIYEEEKERAVNLLQLHSNGLLEMRIQTHRYGSAYQQNRRLLWELAGDLLPRSEFRKVDLLPARRRLWDARSKLVGQVSYRAIRLRSGKGSVATVVSSAPDENLASEFGPTESVDTFLAEDGFIEMLNLYWLESRARPLPSADVHMILSDEMNEFSISGRCLKENYRYAFQKLEAYYRQYSQPGHP